MQRKVIFRDRQEINPADMTNIGDFAQQSFDSLVHDAVSSGNHFTGFSISEKSSTEINVAPGARYHEGEVFVTLEEKLFNLYRDVALTSQRYVAIVVSGQEVDVDVQPRDFLIDLENGASEPQAVAMERLRQANLATISGTESADPQVPTIPEGQLLVGYVLLNTTGISEITMQEDNRLPSAYDNALSIRDLNAWRAQVGPQIDALTTTVAGLKEQTDSLPTLRSVIELGADVAQIKESIQLPTGVSSYESDSFDDDSKTDDTGAGFAARVDNGVLFPNAAEAVTKLDLFNPIDGNAHKAANEFMLPAFESISVLATTGYAGDFSLSALQVQKTTTKPVSVTKRRWVSGWTYRNIYYSNGGSGGRSNPDGAGHL